MEGPGVWIFYEVLMSLPPDKILKLDFSYKEFVLLKTTFALSIFLGKFEDLILKLCANDYF